jgi:thymidylate kinase
MIRTFIKYLDKNSIKYAVTNGYEDLLRNILLEHDVDILFKKKDFLIIEEILENFCEINGFQIVQIYHQEVYAKNIFIYNSKTQELLSLDIYGKLHKNNFVYFTEEEIFNNIITYKDINILVPYQEFTHYLLKKISKNELKKEVFNYLKKIFYKDSLNCSTVLEDHLIETGKIIVESFKNNDFSTLLKEQNNILLDIKTSSPSILYWLQDKVRFFKRIFMPTGISIAFLGPDGSGKTTIIDSLLVAHLPFRRVDYFHLKPIYTSNKTNTITSNPHEFKPYNSIKSYIKLMYFFCQYNLGWIKNIVPLKIRSSFIIFDRYFDDLIVDSKRYRYGGGSFAAKFCSAFIKKPSLYFVLITDAKIIYQRKQEVSFEELENQVKKYKSLVDNKRYFEIDVKESPNLIVKKVQKILMEKMHERY